VNIRKKILYPQIQGVTKGFNSLVMCTQKHPCSKSEDDPKVKMIVIGMQNSYMYRRRETYIVVKESVRATVLLCNGYEG
jgi:hypothetical protein